uniref:Uncharacterized protein n=1 Tax=Haptolina ericina TaxID=156174 RepID=A0A7S3FGM1_9EUKA|mmetsp:Transcript_68024/g.151894  ORF Transcript_68024/g.151894 Transcript_68024/m.151894 type:complete len:102 (+) Transcript_68024:570-875(+)
MSDGTIKHVAAHLRSAGDLPFFPASSERRYKLLASIRRSRSQHVLAGLCDLHRPYIRKSGCSLGVSVFGETSYACLGTGGMIWVLAGCCYATHYLSYLYHP